MRGVPRIRHPAPPIPPMPRPAPPVTPRSRAAPRAAARAAAPFAGDAAAALDALRRIVRELRVTAARAEDETGLSAAQLFVLQQVAGAPGLSLTEIAARTMTDRTSVGAVVERLLARSLVERRPGAVDRRRAEIYPTREGARVLARAPHPPTRRVLDAMAAMGERDVRRLARSLGALAGALGLDGGPAPMLFEDGGRPAAQAPRARRSSGGARG